MMDDIIWRADTINVLFAERDGFDFFFFETDEIYVCRTPEGQYGIGLTLTQALQAAESNMQGKV